MYEVPGKNTIKFEILPPFVCLKTWLFLKEATRQKSFLAFSTSWKLAVDGKLLLRFHDAASVGCEQHALQPLALAVVGVCSLRAVAHERACGTTWFCLVFSKKFNIMSALFVHQSPTLPQKRDSREGWCWCKNGVSMRMWQMNIYLNKPPFAPILGLFAARCSAFWC